MVGRAWQSQAVNAIVTYWAISIAMVFVNRAVLSSSSAVEDRTVQTTVDAPLFIAWFQSLCTVATCWLLGKAGTLRAPTVELRRSVLKDVGPLTAAYVGMIIANSLCLRYVEVSSYQMTRPLSIVFSVLLSYFLLNDATSPRALASCALVLFGFLLGNQQMVHFSVKATVFGLLSSVFIALNAVFTQKKLPIVEYSPWRLTLHNNVNASAMLLPVVLVSGEVPTLLNSEAVYTLRFWAIMAVAGLLGVFLGVASVAQIRYTSPLTHIISSTSKASAQTMLAVWFFGSSLSFLGTCSVVVTMLGALVYAVVRRQEMFRREGMQQHGEPAGGYGRLRPGMSKGLKIDK